MPRRWASRVEAEDALARRHHPPGGVAAGSSYSAWRRWVGLIVVLARLGLNEAAPTLNGTLTKATEAIAFVEEITDVVTRVREALGDATFADATRRGAAIASHEANGYALGQALQALASLGVADVPTHSACLGHGEPDSSTTLRTCCRTRK
jgi:hypothetical protein